MKKWIAFILCIGLLAGLCACGSQESEEESTSFALRDDSAYQLLPDDDADEETALAYGYAASVTLMADLTDEESCFFLLEDPEAFQLDYQILADADGEMPESGDFSVEGKAWRWENCPVLAGLELGSGAEGAYQSLLASLYVGMRCYYHPERVPAWEQYRSYWNTMIAGAIS